MKRRLKPGRLSMEVGCMVSIPREQQRGSERAATGCAHRDARIAWNLAGAAVAAQLHDGLVSKTKPVETAGADLAAEGVERQLAVERDSFAALNVLSAFAHTAKPESLEPGYGLEAESVIQLRG